MKWKRNNLIFIASLVLLVLVLMTLPSYAQLKPFPVERSTPRLEVSPQTAAISAYSSHRPQEVSLGELTTGTGDGFNPGWLAGMQLPAGYYVVSGSATFVRRDYNSGNGTARVECSITGLDRTAQVEFKLHPAEHEPDPSITIPFNVAGRGSGVYLKCPWGGPWKMYARDLSLNAIRVDQLVRP